MHGYAISQQIAKHIANELNGTSNKYYTNLYDNVTVANTLFHEVQTFPMVTVSPGPESYDYQASQIRWTTQVIYIRGYVQDGIQPELELSKLLQDLKLSLTSPQHLSYDITMPSGDVVTYKTSIESFLSSTTDEGVLKPMGILELAVEVKYTEGNRYI